LQQWAKLCQIINCQEWKKSDSKNGVTVSRLSFARNQKAAVKVITVKQRQFSNIFTEEGHLFHGRLSELKKNLNFSLFFGQVVLKCCLPRVTSCSSKVMIFLEHNLPRPLPIGQVSFTNYLPRKKIYLYRTTGWEFFDP